MINFVNENRYRIDEKEIIKYVKYLNQRLNNQKSVSIVLLNNQEIRKLNNEFRNQDKPTDVLSFEDFSIDYLGDIIISFEKMQQQAIDYKHSEKRELYFLITHGILHLLGYDHMIKKDEIEMFDLQEKLLEEYEVDR